WKPGGAVGRDWPDKPLKPNWANMNLRQLYLEDDSSLEVQCSRVLCKKLRSSGVCIVPRSAIAPAD
ncbi:hypothetical protein Tco_1239571, partial [Tanacetum coccineum]